MTILQRIMEELNIREVHEIPTALTKTLLDSNACSALLKAIQPYYSYEALLAEFEEHSADRKNYMQDYTPQCVLDIIGGITPGGNVRDVCAGIGGLSLAKFKSDNTVTLRLEEYSKNAIAFMLLNLLIANIDAEVVEKNVLTGEELAYYKVEAAVSGFGRVAKVDMLGSKKYDTVISNPPYSQSWVPQMDERFEGYKLAPKSKADFAFILDGLYSLNASGTAAFILPHGVLFRGQAEGDIRRKLIEDNLLDAVIGLPSNLFTNTGIPVCVLIFKKNRDNTDILFIDAQKDFVKNKNIMTAEQVEKVIKAYKDRAEIARYSSNISVSTILDNDYNLNIPRYIDSFEPEDIPDAVQLAKELNEINRESRTLGLEIAEMLKQLVCTDPDSQKEHDEFVKEFTEFLVSSDSACTVEEQEAVIKKIEDVCVMLRNYKRVKITEVADILGRPKKNQIYPEGCICLQVSASKGELLYLDTAQQVDAKYVVIQPRNVIPYYLYLMIEKVMPEFLYKYRQGLNISAHDIKHMEILCHTDVETQALICMMFQSMHGTSLSAQYGRFFNA